MFRSSNWTVGNLIDDLRLPKSLQSATLLMWQSKDKSNYFVVELSSSSISPDSVLFWHFKWHIRGSLIIANYSFCVCGGVGFMSILGDVSKIYKQYTLVRQDNFPLSSVVCLDAVVIVILILSHYAFICSVYLPHLLLKWLAWVKLTRMQPIAYGCSLTPNPAPIASPQYRKTRAATTCSVLR